MQAALSRLAAMAGVHLAKATPIDELRTLIGSLRPRKTAAGLERIGPPHDGGYLIPRDIEGIAACFSPGVDVESGFEWDCAERGIPVFMADGSVAAPPRQHDLFHFRPNYLGASSGKGFIRFDDWVEESRAPRTGDLLVQMDIEGFEYEVLLSLSDALLSRVRIFVIEFHRLHQLVNDPWFRLVSRVFTRLLATHACVHIHPNNSVKARHVRGLGIPPLLEMTFLRRDRLIGDGYQTSFPHPLDAPNVPGPDVVLPRCWYET